MKFKDKVRRFAIPVSTALMLAPCTISAFAAEGESGAAGIDLPAITSSAMTQIQSDMTVVIAASAAASITLVSITVGIAYLIKKAKGMKSVG